MNATRNSEKYALIAGGGSGIGRGCALKLSELGYEILLLGRTKAKLENVAREIRNMGGKADIYQADVSDWDALEAIGEGFAEPGLDLLLNSAGGQTMIPTAQMVKDDWHGVVDKNLTGSFYLARHFYPALKARKGCIVNIVANMWQMPAPGLAHSAAARAGVVNLTKTLAKEWASDGIRANAVAPGLTDSGALPEHFKVLADRVPLGRIGEVEDITGAVAYLAGASYVTGEVISVDGGFRFV